MSDHYAEVKKSKKKVVINMRMREKMENYLVFVAVCTSETLSKVENVTIFYVRDVKVMS